MRLLFLIFVLASFIFFIACKEENNEIHSAEHYPSIDGKWELLQVQAGMTPTKFYTPGNGNILKFTNSQYQAFSNGQLTKSGTFNIVKDASVEKEVCLDLPDNQYKQRITYENDTNTGKLFFHVSNDTLTFLTGCFALDAGNLKKYLRN